MSTELYDTHCHLNLQENFPAPEPYFQNALSAGVTRLNLVSLDLASSYRAVELAENHEGVFAIIGRHPNYAADYDPAELKSFEEILSHPKVVALGEIGLDYHWDYATREQQEICLLDQLDLAERVGKPVVFHCREAYADLLSLLEERRRLPFLFHCFSGNSHEAERALALGAYLGVDGPLTYKKADELRALVGSLPRDRVVLETDSPYLSPEPFRGKPNEPAHLAFVNRTLAKVWEISEEESARTTTENALAFFRLCGSS